jgi:hypothetical protein
MFQLTISGWKLSIKFVLAFLSGMIVAVVLTINTPLNYAFLIPIAVGVTDVKGSVGASPMIQ